MAFRTKKGPRWAGWIPGSSTCGQIQGRGEHSSCRDTRTTPCYHIVESWDIEKMMEEHSTDEYYDALRKDMGQRHPKACTHTCWTTWCRWKPLWISRFCLGFPLGLGKQRSALLKGNSWATPSGGTGVRRTLSGAKRSPLPAFEGEVAY